MAFDANDLSPHEHFVVERTRLGEMADLSPMTGPGGAKPVIRAGFLRKLLLRLDPAWPVHAPGVRIQGARIEGALDLTECSGEPLPVLVLAACEIPQPLDVSAAQLAALSLADSRLAQLIADAARIEGDLDLARCAPSGAPGHETLTVRARGVRVGGGICANGAKLARPIDTHGFALILDNAEVSGNLSLDGEFESFGGVSLASARIGGTLSLNGAQVLNRADAGSAPALAAEGARIGAVFLEDKCRIEGAADFSGAEIAGDIRLRHGSFRNEGALALSFANARIGGEIDAYAARFAGKLSLRAGDVAGDVNFSGAEIAHSQTRRGNEFALVVDASFLKVAGSVVLNGVNAKGEILLEDTVLGGRLALGGGRYIHGGHWAICATGARIAGDVTFTIPDSGFAPHGQKTVVEGGVKLERIAVGGALVWAGLELRGPGPSGAKGAALSLASAKIAGPLQARALTTQQDASIDLTGAACALLDDDIASGWGSEAATLALDGFAYGRIARTDEKWRARLAWLKRNRGRFSTQPYDAVARAYVHAGRREDARRAALARHDLQTRASWSNPLLWGLSSLFGLACGYGLSPLRMLRALVLFFALGVAGVLAMNAQGALVTPTGAACNGAVEPALYALDVAVPIVDLGQDSRCAPGRTARADLPAGVAVSEAEDWRLFEGAALWKWAHALYAMFGAVLTALAVFTFAGFARPTENSEP
jgi:hypothetical protein